jgi:hypothetical protein
MGRDKHQFFFFGKCKASKNQENYSMVTVVSPRQGKARVCKCMERQTCPIWAPWPLSHSSYKPAENTPAPFSSSSLATTTWPPLPKRPLPHRREWLGLAWGIPRVIYGYNGSPLVQLWISFLFFLLPFLPSFFIANFFHQPTLFAESSLHSFWFASFRFDLWIIATHFVFCSPTASSVSFFGTPSLHHEHSF